VEAKMLAMSMLLSEGGEIPNTSLQGGLFVGIAFFLLMVIVGWLTSNRNQDQAEVTHEAQKSAKKKPDDLIKIEGIDTKVAKVLREADITTFDDLAGAKAADVQRVLDAAGLQMMNPEGWIVQAKLAAQGDWKALEKLQSELKGGRKAK
jgi:preprotein translocase subunit YajC